MALMVRKNPMLKNAKVVALNPYTRALHTFRKLAKDEYLLAKIEEIALKSRLIKSHAQNLAPNQQNDLLLREVGKVTRLSDAFLSLVANPDLGEKDRASQMLMAGYTLKRQQRVLKDLKPTHAALIFKRLSKFLAGSPH